MISERDFEGGPKYPQLEQLFRQAMQDGKLRPGDKLPPLRQAAWSAGCSLGTMARVYTSLERQGLVTSEVGRGTFVKEPDSLTTNVILPPGGGGSRDLAMINLVQNEIWHGECEDLFRQTMARATEKMPSVHISGYGDGSGHDEYKERVLPLLPAPLQGARPDSLLFTHGVQHGLYTILSRLAGHGDGVAVEPISYPGIRAIVSQHGLNPFPVDTDDQGLLPDSLDAVCRDGRVRMLLTSPTGQNPTSVTSGLKRRQAICAVARKHDLLIVEDDIYGHLYPDSPPPYAALLPEQSIFLSGLSKRVAPALRVGIALVPSRYRLLMAQAITTQSWMVSPLLVAAMAEIAGRRDHLDRIAAESLAESNRRAAHLKTALNGLVQHIDHCVPHAWIKLPEGMDDETLAGTARQMGVLVTEGYRFSNRPTAEHSHIRIALLSSPSAEMFETGVNRLGQALRHLGDENAPVQDLSFV